MNSPSATNPAEFSVLELMASGRYTVPLYQRNYAWGEVEIVQLLQDLRDASSHKTPNYYLGSLVVHAHTDGHFEIIDGQQRHTTLCILLAVLKNEFKRTLVTSSAPDPIAELNLGFDCRSVSDKTLKLLFEGQVSHDQALVLEPAMLSAYKLIQKHLPLVLSKGRPTPLSTDNWIAFTNYTLEKVKLLRVIVPASTDMNHYFEIMNSRGEQLEMHEILKARLMKVLDPSAQKGFGTLWDACADMQRFALMGFSAAERTAAFGADWNDCPLDFDAYLQKISQTIAPATSPSNAGASNPLSLAEIANSPKFRPKDTKGSSEADAEGRFGAVINFPNFLLQVLLIKKQDKSVPLDDKRLLDTFEREESGADKFTPDFVKAYAITLLRLRLLWDRFITKSSAEKWSLKCIQRDSQKTSFSLVNTFASPSPQAELEMLLSMFHVSFPAQSNKHWLTAALNYLHTENLTCTALRVDGPKYLNFLECLSDRFFFGRHGADANTGAAIPAIDYPELLFDSTAVTSARVLDVSALHKGTGVENFIFNRLDYLLWKRCQAKNLPEHGDALQDFDKLLGEFRFTFRSSVEHYYPQHPRDHNEAQLPTLKDCDNFGNLCLISHSNNSRYSDFLPAAKKQLRAASKSSESLKQLFMMSYPHWGPEHESTMYAHESAMIDVLKQRAICLTV
jgi:hypothetical protein